jgi:hypothetical protein
MKVTSSVAIDFPKLGWGINAGEEHELPEDKAAQAIILATPEISEVKEKGKREHLSH